MATAVKKTKKSTAKATSATKKRKVAKKALDKKNIKNTIKKVVQSKREIKYNYPAKLTDILERKSWRQKVRSKIRNFEASFEKLKGKALSTARAEYKAYRKEVLLVP